MGDWHGAWGAAGQLVVNLASLVVVGAITLAVIAVILAWLFIEKVVFGEDIGGRPLLILGFMLFLSSVQLITTGILAEMLARTYYRDDAQPNYIVRTVFLKDPAE